MHIAQSKPLFAWDRLEDSPSLSTLKSILASIPDDRLLDQLRQYRGRGRNEYPVHVLWGVVVLRIALRHTTVEATLGELSRNAELRRLIGIESESRVPKPWNVSPIPPSERRAGGASGTASPLSHELRAKRDSLPRSEPWVRGVRHSTPWLR